MAKAYKRHDLLTFGGRLAFYREKAGFTQVKFAKELKVSRQLLASWERNIRNSYRPYLSEICKLLDVQENLLLNGVPLEDQNLADTLGLSHNALEQLKYAYSHRNISMLDAQYDTGFAGTVEGEGGSNSLLIKTVNLLLSTNCGVDILRSIGCFCFADFENAYPVSDEVDSSYESLDGFSGLEPVSSLRFSLPDTPGGCTVSADLLRFALLKDIEQQLSVLRENAKDYERLV